jgi:hypothetical protein
MITAAEIPARGEAEWAAIIQADLGRAVESIVASGKHLIEARCELGRGRWGDMLRTIDMHEREAERRMLIGENPVLSDPAYACRLPASMRTLAELARLPKVVLEGYIKDGTVSPETTRREAEKLVSRQSRPTGSGSRNRAVIEPSAPPKPLAADEVKAMVAKMAANAEAEAAALAADEESMAAPSNTTAGVPGNECGQGGHDLVTERGGTAQHRRRESHG